MLCQYRSQFLILLWPLLLPVIATALPLGSSLSTGNSASIVQTLSSQTVDKTEPFVFFYNSTASIMPIYTEVDHLVIQGDTSSVIHHLPITAQAGYLDFHQDGIIDVYYQGITQINLAAAETVIISLPAHHDQVFLEQSHNDVSLSSQAGRFATTVFTQPIQTLDLRHTQGDSQIIVKAAPKQAIGHLHINSTSTDTALTVHVKAPLHLQQSVDIKATAIHINAPITTATAITLQAYQTVSAEALLKVNAPLIAPQLMLSSERDTWITDKLRAEGGIISVLGQQIYVIEHAVLDTSSEIDGGTILIGRDNTITNSYATDVVIGPETLLRADALYAGDGGDIVIWSKEIAQIQGNLSAQGGMIAGQGGFVETSSRQGPLQISRAPNVSAPVGQQGQWLIDPYDIEIIAGGGYSAITTTSPFVSMGDTATLSVQLITEALTMGDVVIETASEGDQAGNISLNADLDFSFIGIPSTLTLKAANDIILNANIGSLSDEDKLNLVLLADADNLDGGSVVCNSGILINTGGGDLTAQGKGHSLQNHGIQLNACTLNSQAGNLTLEGQAYAAGDNSAGIYISSGSIVETTQAGNLTLKGNQGRTGILIEDTNSRLKTVNGDLTLEGVNADIGIQISNGAILESTGKGQIILKGMSVGDDPAIFLTRASTFFPPVKITSNKGAIAFEAQNYLTLEDCTITQTNNSTIEFIADEIDFLGETQIKGKGTLHLTPFSADLAVQVGILTESTGLDLSLQEIAALQDGFNQITINGAAIALGETVTFQDPIKLEAIAEDGIIQSIDQTAILTGLDDATIELVAKQTIDIGQVKSAGQKIAISSQMGDVTTAHLDTADSIGGDVVLAGKAIKTGYIKTVGATGAGGDITIRAAHFFRATADTACNSVADTCSIDSSGQGTGGTIIIEHGGNGVTPFIIGNDTVQGTVAAISSGEALLSLTAPVTSFLYEHMEAPNIHLRTASMETSHFTLTLAQTGTGTGTVSVSPSDVSPCEATCTLHLPGTPVTLVATPQTGSVFKGWVEPACTNPLTLTESMTCTATFDQLPVAPPSVDYYSIPSVNQTLDWGAVWVDTPVELTLRVSQQGTLPLVIQSAVFEGQEAEYFQINTPLPHSVYATASIAIQCHPTQPGLHQATLTLHTNARNMPTATYPLSCLGEQPAQYLSMPAPNDTMHIGETVTNKAISQILTIEKGAGADLQVDAFRLTGEHASDFAVILPTFPFTLTDTATTQAVRIKCEPSDKGLRTAQLEITSNDPRRRRVNYSLTCTGLLPPTTIVSSTITRYQAAPEPNSTLDFGVLAMGETATQNISITTTQHTPLQPIEINIQGAGQRHFQLTSPLLPPIVTEKVEINVACQPIETGLHTAELVITSNEVNQPIFSYALMCTGIASSQPQYVSVPLPNEQLDFGETPVDTPTTQMLSIAHEGDVDMIIDFVAIEGPAAADFEILSTDFPLTLTDVAREQSLLIQCTPIQAGLRKARLVLASNDPLTPSSSYALNCMGTASGTIYDSMPKPQKAVLEIAPDELGHPTTLTHLTVLNAGTETLNVSASTITGKNAQDFTITSGQSPFAIEAGAPSHQITIGCTPRVSIQYDATLTLTTNDPLQPTVHYTLICKGVDEWYNAVISGSIHTETGKTGTNITVNALENFTLKGFIAPAKRHFEQLADIKVMYHWLPITGKPLIIPVTIAKQKQLTANQMMELTLFEGNIVNLEGTFQVDLGYYLNTGEYVSAEVATLTTRPNQPSTAIILTGHEIIERSPEEAVIGTLTTVDPDKNDQFVYFLTEDGGGHFKIVGNELRTTAFPLLLEAGSERHVTVRSVDTAHHAITKTFVIHVMPADIALEAIYLTHQTVLENSPAGVIIGKFLTSGDDTSSTYVYDLIDDANGRFGLAKDVLVVLEGAELDFETQKNHEIVVRRRKAGTTSILEKTFTLEVINTIDVQIEEAHIRDETGQTISPNQVNALEVITIEIQLVPDKAHIGQTVELIGAALYLQQNKTTTFMLDGQIWRAWDGDLNTLQPIRTLTLQAHHALTLWQGQLTDFSAGELQLFMGYRLNSNEVIIQPESFNIRVVQ